MNSIRGQIYEPLDILISDNASEDGTEALCRELAASDSRIRYVRHPHNIGLHGNHNYCIDEARGEYFCIFHDHDRRDVRLVSKYVSFLNEHPSVGVVCSDWDLIDDADHVIGIRDHRVDAMTPGLDYITRTIRSGRSAVGIPGAMVRRAALGQARFIPDAPIGFGDFPLWFTLAEHADIGHINERLWSWRQNTESHSARTIESIAQDYERNLEQYCDGHLSRWPGHAPLVTLWRASMRQYLFWALAYEVMFHFRSGTARGEAAQRSLFEIMDYRLTPAQFDHAVSQMRRYRSTPSQHTVFALMKTLIDLRVTWPLGWITRHQATLRGFLKMN
jgi:glycosyltransferase involved in cell wall biosynthesis